MQASRTPHQVFSGEFWFAWRVSCFSSVNIQQLNKPFTFFSINPTHDLIQMVGTNVRASYDYAYFVDQENEVS